MVVSEEFNKVGVLDYIVLVVILLISVAIGLYQGYKQQINRLLCHRTKIRPVKSQKEDETNDLETVATASPSSAYSVSAQLTSELISRASAISS